DCPFHLKPALLFLVALRQDAVDRGHDFAPFIGSVLMPPTRLAVMEAMREIFPQLKHDREWSSECARLWREVDDDQREGERLMNRAFRIAERLRAEMDT